MKTADQEEEFARIDLARRIMFWLRTTGGVLLTLQLGNPRPQGSSAVALCSTRPRSTETVVFNHAVHGLLLANPRRINESSLVAGVRDAKRAA